MDITQTTVVFPKSKSSRMFERNSSVVPAFYQVKYQAWHRQCHPKPHQSGEAGREPLDLSNNQGLLHRSTCKRIIVFGFNRQWKALAVPQSQGRPAVPAAAPAPPPRTLTVRCGCLDVHAYHSERSPRPSTGNARLVRRNSVAQPCRRCPLKTEMYTSKYGALPGVKMGTKFHPLPHRP